MAGMANQVTRPDGRRLRAERSETAVVDAMLDLFREGVLRPSVAEVARRAGVSERTVFRLFDDVEALTTATITRQTARAGHLFAPPDSRGGRDERIEALIAQRLTLYEEIAPVMRAMRHCLPSSPPIREAAEARDRLLRRQVERQFRPELDRLPPVQRAELLTALDIAVSLETLEQLRRSKQQSIQDARAVIVRMIRELLSDAELHVDGVDD
jgi:AcrR family transcriptional regulator